MLDDEEGGIGGVFSDFGDFWPAVFSDESFELGGVFAVAFLLFRPELFPFVGVWSGLVELDAECLVFFVKGLEFGS